MFIDIFPFWVIKIVVLSVTLLLILSPFEIVFVLSIIKICHLYFQQRSKVGVLPPLYLRSQVCWWRLVRLGHAPTIPGTRAINSTAQTQSSSHLDPALDVNTGLQGCRYLDSIVIYSVDITWWLVLDMSGGLLLPESAVPS